MCHKIVLLLMLLCMCLASSSLGQQQLQQQRLRLPPGYNMRLGALPTRFVGKGAYTLSGKPPAKWQQQQQQQQLQPQSPQQQQRMQLFQWATMGNRKKYN